MKFKGHETFFIRKNWITKGIKNILLDSTLFTDKNNNPMDALGIGSNMVKSLRYWLCATGVVREDMVDRKKNSRLTKLGELVWKYDQYTEEFGTLWLLHYSLVKNFDQVTSWYYFFNKFNLSEFSKEDFVNHLTNEVNILGGTTSIRSLEDDFNCIISSYLPRYKVNNGKVNPEDNMECPLTELGIIDYQNKKYKTYKKITPSKDVIPPLILLAILLDCNQGVKEITLVKLLNAECNIGKIFNLDIITLLGIITQLENQGFVKLIRTSGLDILRIETELDYLGCIEKYYKSLINVDAI